MNKVVIDVEARFNDGVSNKADKASSVLYRMAKAAGDVRDRLNGLGKARPTFDADNSKLLKKIREAEAKADKLGKTKTRLVLEAADKATAVIGKAIDSAKRFSRGVYSASLLLRDTGVGRMIGSIYARLQDMVKRPWTIPLRLKDAVTAPLKALTDRLFNIKTLIGGIVAGAAFNKIIATPVQSYAEYEDLVAQFSVLLGDQTAAEERLSSLVDFAGQTPFTRDEIFQASRVLQTYTGGALATPDATGGLRMIGDIAAATGQEYTRVATYISRLYNEVGRGGTSMGEPLMLLREIGALSSESEQRIQAIAQGSGTVQEKWEKIAGEFSSMDGMMLVMSDQMKNLLLGVKTLFRNNVTMKIGEGISSSLKPFLKDFRTWKSENSELIQSAANGIRDISAALSGKVLRSVQKITSSAWKLIGSPEFKAATMSGKASMLLDFGVDYAKTNFIDPLTKWWEDGGRAKTTEKASKIGAETGKLLTGALTGIFGTVSAGADLLSGASSTGGSVAGAFVQGFKDNFDGGAIKDAFLGAVDDVWGAMPWWVKSLIIAKGASAVAGGVTDAVVGANAFKQFFGGGERSGVHGMSAGTVKISAGVVYVNGSVMGGTGGAGGPLALPGGASGAGKATGALSGILKGAGKLAKGAGYLTAAAVAIDSITDIFSGNPGSAFSKLGGTALGAAIGSAILPGLGTAIGAALGGLAGEVAAQASSPTTSTYRSRNDPGTLTTTAQVQSRGRMLAAGRERMATNESMRRTVTVDTTLEGKVTDKASPMVANSVNGMKDNYTKPIGVSSNLVAKLNDRATGEIRRHVGSIKSSYDKPVSILATLRARITDLATPAINNAAANASRGATYTSQRDNPKFRGGIVGGPSALQSFADGGMVRGGAQLVRVAEEGTPEMIIPLGSQRRERGRKLWEKAGEMLRVPGFARGGLTDYAPDSSLRSGAFSEASVAPQSASVDVGGVTVHLTVNAGSDRSVAAEIKAKQSEIEEAVTSAICAALGRAFQNTPVRGGAA